MWSSLDGFPSFYRHEPVFSHCARLTKRQQPVSNADWLKKLFGKKYQYAIIDLPTNLASYSSWAPVVYGYSPDYLIDHHTAAPFYVFGRTEQQILHMRESMKTNGAANIHVYAGLANARLLRPIYLRVCQRCYREDCGLNQHPHWYIDHQLAGISTCPRHGIKLTETQIFSKRLNSFIAVEDALEGVDFEVQPIPSDPKLVELAQDAAYLLDHPETQITLSQIHQLYSAACAEQRLIFRSGRIDLRRAAERVRDYYPPTMLNDLNLSLVEQTTKTWAYELLAAPKVVRPSIKHLLVIRALGFTVQNFLAMNTKHRLVSSSFGVGPWPCLNKASSHYMELTIKTSRIRRINGQLRGEFACECGFIYSLTEPQSGQVSDLNTSVFQGYSYRIIEYGETWDTLLRLMWADETINLAEMAQYLGVTSDTVKAQAPRLGLEFPPAGSPHIKPPKPNRIRKNQRLRIKYEALWLNMREMFPEATITELQLLLPKQSMYLRLYDKEWFEANCPTARPRGTCFVDWDILDTTLAEQVRKVAIDYHGQPHFARRITTAVLSKGIGLDSNFLSSRASKLPKTSAILNQYIETPVQHALHRLDLIQERCRNEKVSFTAYQIRKQAGLSEQMAAEREVKELIHRIMTETI